MPRRTFRFACVIAAAAASAGCTDTSQNVIRAQIIGGAAGAALGGFAGAQLGGGLGRTMLTAGGVLLGGAVGAAAGPGLLGVDWNLHADAAAEAASENAPEPRYWSNPETGREGMIRPMQAYTSPEGRPCRAYRATVTVEGAMTSGNGVACMTQNGEWRVVTDRFS